MKCSREMRVVQRLDLTAGVGMDGVGNLLLRAVRRVPLVALSPPRRRAGITPLWPPFVVFVYRFIVIPPLLYSNPSLSLSCCWVVSLRVVRFVLRCGNKRRLLPLLMIPLRMFSGESGFLRWFRLFIFPFFCETYNVDIVCSNKNLVPFMEF